MNNGIFNGRHSRVYSISNWDDWVEICVETGDDPREVSWVGYDLGGGNSAGYEYIGEYPKKEE